MNWWYIPIWLPALLTPCEIAIGDSSSSESSKIALKEESLEGCFQLFREIGKAKSPAALLSVGTLYRDCAGLSGSCETLIALPSELWLFSEFDLWTNRLRGSDEFYGWQITDAGWSTQFLNSAELFLVEIIYSPTLLELTLIKLICNLTCGPLGSGIIYSRSTGALITFSASDFRRK